MYAPAFDEVYDYVLRIVGDLDVAAGVMRETFAKARRAFGEHGTDVAPWLLGTARACALDALRYRRDRNGDVREALRFTGVDADRMPNFNVVFDLELVELVWDAATALPRDDYSLLVLDVRHDLPAEAIGEHLGLNGTVSTRLTRVREAFDDAVLGELVVRRARHACAELDDVLVREHEPHRVAQHVRHCTLCQESSRRFASPSEVLGALEPIAPAGALYREIFGPARRRRFFGML